MDLSLRVELELLQFLRKLKKARLPPPDSRANVRQFKILFDFIKERHKCAKILTECHSVTDSCTAFDEKH